METAIKKAIEGGWCPTEHGINEWWVAQLKLNPNKDWTFSQWEICFGTDAINRHLLDPIFWQALGKAEGWDGSTWTSQYQDGWLYHWHRFIDHIAEDKDIDSFFEELLPTKQ